MLEFLPESTVRTEPWDFESAHIEEECHWATTVRGTPMLDRLVSSLGRRRQKKQAPSSSGKSILRHLVLVSDPIHAVSGGNDWSDVTVLKDIAARTHVITNSTIATAVEGGGDTDPSRAALAEVCDALGVGLVIDGAPAKVVQLCPERNLWLRRTETSEERWECVPWCVGAVSESAIRGLIREKIADITTGGNSSMCTLREVAASIGITGPLPRSKEQLLALIRRDIG